MTPTRPLAQAPDYWAKTVAEVVTQIASAYVCWIAGHGAEAATVCRHIEDISVFPSHFVAWSEGLTMLDVFTSLPTLVHVLDCAGRTGLMPGQILKGWSTVSEGARPVPPVVSKVLVIAVQWTLLRESSKGTTPVAFNAVFGALINNLPNLPK